MYSVFLVEDEIVIREGIKNLIEWSEFGFDFVGEATDGEIAWPLIQKQKPDIVITDIKMPFMDGLALSRLIKKELPQTTILILSGYDDFSYAKEAIAIGVTQYLLKPLSKGQLMEILQDIKKQRDKEKAKNCYLDQFNSEIQEYLTSSRRGLFDTLVGGKCSMPELLARGEKLNLDLVAQSYNIVLFLLEENLRENCFSVQSDAQEYICDCFPKNENMIMFCISVDEIAFLVKADTDDITWQTEACVMCLTEICCLLEKTLKWSIIVSRPVCRLSAVAECYRMAHQKIFHRIADPECNVYYVGDSTVLSTKPAVMDFNPNDMDAAKLDQRIVEKFLTNGLNEELSGFVLNYFNSIGTKAIQSTVFRQYVVLNIQFTVNAFLEKLGFSKDAVISLQKKDLQLQDAIVSLEGSERYVQELLERALILRDTAVIDRYGSMLHKAQDYMKANYSDTDISLNAVAKIVNISPTHFSAVFSQQMGKTFVEYLTELRMEKAKELLRCTDKSSGDIAFKVGYNDPHYFSFLFKKVNGCSPRDYRSGRNNI